MLFGSVVTLPWMNVCTLEPQATPGHWAGWPERDAAGAEGGPRSGRSAVVTAVTAVHPGYGVLFGKDS